MVEHKCPFCNSELELDHQIEYKDYSCQKKDHFFSKRIEDKDLIKIKLFLRDDDGQKVFLKINFDEGASEVWTNNSRVARNKIDYAFEPDFNDRRILLAKIKTLLVFS